MSQKPEIRTFGKSAFLIEWSDEISQFNHEQVNALNHIIKKKYGDSIIETTPSYQSLAIYLKNDVDTSFLKKNINHLLHKNSISNTTKTREVHIPVCYDKEFGSDLVSLSEFHDLSIDSIIAHHTKPFYPVYFIGFLPGFPYLQGLNPMIATPRKETPRRLVRAGSVGIAGDQTGVYPMDSPGGWNIIGRSPILFFDVHNNTPSLFKTGDLVKFFAVTKEEFHEIKKEVQNNSYEPKTVTRDD